MLSWDNKYKVWIIFQRGECEERGKQSSLLGFALDTCLSASLRSIWYGSDQWQILYKSWDQILNFLFKSFQSLQEYYVNLVVWIIVRNVWNKLFVYIQSRWERNYVVHFCLRPIYSQPLNYFSTVKIIQFYKCSPNIPN